MSNRRAIVIAENLKAAIRYFNFTDLATFARAAEVDFELLQALLSGEVPDTTRTYVLDLCKKVEEFTSKKVLPEEVE